jgi:hypothetical protein
LKYFVGSGALIKDFFIKLMIINKLHQFISLSLFALMQKVTKKIKAVLKSYDFAKAPAARKKLAPPASGLKQFFA